MTGVFSSRGIDETSLGAKLTGPRFLRGIERFFEGSIRVQNNPLPPYASPVTWFDVVSHAKTNPDSFTLTSLTDGSRCCRFVCKGLQIEIGEDDWRLISSGALDRFPLEHPFEEDETAEIATLDILEQRSAALFKKADEVAARARILHRRLGQRRQELKRKRGPPEGSSIGLPALHATGPNARRQSVSGPSYDLHSDLLQQFTSTPAPRTPGPTFARTPAAVSVPPPSRPTSSGSAMPAMSGLGPLSPRSCAVSPHRQRIPGQSSFVTTPRPAESTTIGSTSLIVFDTSAEIYRALVMQKTDKLGKWEAIDPPCDRCRRLRLQCIKHLTACQGCTKKHAKCSWKHVTEEEATRLRQELGVLGPVQSGGEGKAATDSSEASSSRNSGIGRSSGSAPSLGPVNHLGPTLGPLPGPPLGPPPGPTFGLMHTPGFGSGAPETGHLPMVTTVPEASSRAPSRSDSPVGPLPMVKTEMSQVKKLEVSPAHRRTSLPTERLNRSFLGGREAGHIGPISTILSPTAYKVPFGSVVSNPSSR
ncbi:hypothetical protein ESCO_001573 [Escovopsis weberi]|uniref:Zn(2)-C6 fungal-type domain-containing protein n=1 Tax=Escovopsis weberi TaxID=150374 RepID=A0A0M9VWP4_ESCWE|nr:hypothetical protein ESCO_001573 [Escovopsis weberi]